MKLSRKPALLTVWLAVAGLLVTGCDEDSLAGSPISEASGADASVAEVPEFDEIANAEALEVIPPYEIPLPTAVSEVVRLMESGVTDEVLLAYIAGISDAFELSVEDILYLHDIGLSSEAITALIQRSGHLREELLETVRKLDDEAAIAAAPPTDAPLAVEAPTAPRPVVYASETVEIPATAPQEVHVFYRELAPYGSWIHLDGHGWCWQPTVAVVNVDWRPYHDRGRWFYSSHGWYWHSHYTWGWAPFHYGRWYAHPVRGWVWFPGSTWGPAWVTWRVYDGYYGWAPLPPTAHYVAGHGFYYRQSRVSVSFSFGLRAHHFAFVPSRHFGDPHFHRHTLRGPRVQNVFVNSTVINNIVVGDNNTIINRGIDVQKVERSTHVPRVAVRDARPGDRATSPDRLKREGGETVAFRRLPSLPSSDHTRHSLGERGGQEFRRHEPGARGADSRTLGRNGTVTGGAAQISETGRSTLRLPSTERGTVRSAQEPAASAREAEGGRTVRLPSGPERRSGTVSTTPQPAASPEASAPTRFTDRTDRSAGRSSSPVTQIPSASSIPSGSTLRQPASSRESSTAPSTPTTLRLPSTQSAPTTQREPIIIRPSQEEIARREQQRVPTSTFNQQPARLPAVTSPAPVAQAPNVSTTQRPSSTLRLPTSQPSPAVQSPPAVRSAPTVQAPVQQSQPFTIPSQRSEVARPSYTPPAQTYSPPVQTRPAPVRTPSVSAPPAQTYTPPAQTFRLPSSGVSVPQRPAPRAVTPAPAPRPSFNPAPSSPPSGGTIRLPSPPRSAPPPAARSAPPSHSAPAVSRPPPSAPQTGTLRLPSSRTQSGENRRP